MDGITKHYNGEMPKIIHTESMCDKCGKEVGKDNLRPVPFYYLNKDDKFHKDMSPGMRAEKIKKIKNIYNLDELTKDMLISQVYVEPGYRQYRVCFSCYKDA